MTAQTSETNECCGTCFRFDLVNFDEVSDLTFHKADGNTILVVYTKDGRLYFSISYDCGQTFEPPEEMTDIGGMVKDVRILTKGDQFVVTLSVGDNESKMDIKKAISGYMRSIPEGVRMTNQYVNSKRDNFYFKPCALSKPKKRIVNISLSFRDYTDEKTGVSGEESVDHTFYLNDNGEVCMDCDGHRCIIE